MTPSRNLANLSGVFKLFRVIGHVLFFFSRRRRLRERCQKRKRKGEGKKKKRERGDLGRARRWGGPRRTPSIHPGLCLRWADTAESLDSVGSPVVPVKSDSAFSDRRHGSGRRRHAGKLFGKKKKKSETRRGVRTLPPFLPPRAIHPLWSAFLSNVKPFTWNDSRRPSGGVGR